MTTQTGVNNEFLNDLSVTGNLTVSALNTVDGIVQTNAAGDLSTSVTLPDGTLATTQSQGDNTTKVSTTAYVEAHEGNGIWTRIATAISPTNTNDDLVMTGTGKIGVGITPTVPFTSSFAGGDHIKMTGTSGTDIGIVLSPNGASANDAQIRGTASGTSTILSILTGGSTTMIIDENGLVIKPFQSAFMAYNSALQTNVTGDSTVVSPTQFDIELFDQNNDYNNTSDTYTAPRTGRYFFKISLGLSSLLSTHTKALMQIITSNNSFGKFQNVANTRDSDNNLVFEESFFVDMDQSDTAVVSIAIFNGTKTVGVGGTVNTHFSGYLAL